MKIQSTLIITLCAAVLFVSCDREETNDDQWRTANEAQFAKITTDPAYTRINSASTAGHIMYKKIKTGEGETPYFTDRVKVLYTGWFKYDWSQTADSYKDERGETVTNKYIFDSTESRNNIPSIFSVNPSASSGIIDGISTALQHMKVGDKWEIWIPWRLGYGASSQGAIKAYTTLVFEIELVGIVR
ncbi:MAG: FKBP-type peptidyl-prolyl cis-trans isomerase [Proteiniphilum sp.]|jgi:peptidylprolyl isomerase/FKBP-type peptidyl-prolyl cis-trans isomerase FklB|nr:FKBP-type peptidyl-prolyl cis-trans isomerase [Proteiniphilum sp.]